MDDATQQWTWVAEPEVKALLAAEGATVPRWVVVDDVAGARAAAAGLRAPLVVKLVVPGLVHKSEVGGVRLGLGDAAAVAEAAAGLLKAAARRGGPGPARLLVEEQAPTGIELVVGARSDEGFGPVLLVGLGGIWVEVLDDVAVGFAPLAPGEGRALLRRLRAWPVLAGQRGHAAVDLDAVDEVLVAVGRVAADQGGAPFELDANPVIVSPAGAVVADARLGHGPRPPAASTGARGAATGGLDVPWRPRRVAVAGADPDRPGLGNVLLREYRRAVPARPLVALHPRAADVAEVEGVATVATLAGSAPVDLLTVTVPEADVMATLADAAAAGTKVVHLFTGPSTQDAAARRRWRADVLDTARHGGLRVLGPNAMGVHHAEGGLSFVPGSSLAPGGSVSVVCQSGGLAADLVSLGEASGVRFARVVSIGDAIDIDVAELVGSFLDDPATEVIGAYVETARGARALHDVLRHAAVPKPVVVLVGGSSPAGARAAGSHTGALSGDRRLWDALAASVGANVVTSLEDFVTTLLCHQRLGRVDVGGRHGALVVATGGDGVLLADLLSAAGVPVPALSDEALHHLEVKGHAGIGRTNPVDLAQLGALLDRGSGDGVLRDVVTGVLDHQPLSEVVVQLGLTSLFLYFPRPERLVDRLLGAVEELCAAQPAARMAVVVHATGISAEAGSAARARLRDVVVVTDSARRAAEGLAAVAARSARRRSWAE